jgi:hypothetical protein
MLSRFVPSPTSSPQPCVDDVALVEDVRCLVRLRGSRGSHDLIVGSQADNELTVVEHDRARLSQRVQAQLAFHEVAAARMLTLDVAELWVFDLQVLELLMDAPGLDDPMYLYGKLRGPYPASASGSMTIEGQLTVTRSDLLRALIEGTEHAFMYRPDSSGSRCVHALLPGERADLIDDGHGVVVALPLAPVWSLESSAANDRVVAQLFYDVLCALNKELGEPDELPVPSRANVAAELEAQGWTVEGDVATRTTRSGLLGTLLPDKQKKQLPREGKLEEYVAAARAALGKIGTPSRESLALRRRCEQAPSALRTPNVPKSAEPPAPTETSLPRQPRPQVAASPTDWMKDFVHQHEAPGKPKPRVVAPARVVGAQIGKRAAPAWMEDFAPAPAGPKENDDDDE